MHDLIISGGTLVDGTGSEPRTADVAVDSGRITEVGANLGSATRTMAADGLLVTPGWVDIHTHYDGQATWDTELAPSSWHGVTTLVMGNCGVGFAPARPDRHDWLIGLMEGVEDIPGAALSEGIEWEWETFPQYLDALERRRWTVDVGTQVPHGAVRAYVMGERGARNEPASPEEIDAMRAIVLEALRAGALGFSSSRTIGHRAIDGEPVPGTYAAEDELFGIGSALAEAGTGIFELAPVGSAGELLLDAVKEIDWMRRLSAKIDRPVTYVLLQVDDDPELWRAQLAASLEACDEGAQLRPQVAGRPTGILSGHHTTLQCLLSDISAYQDLRARDLSPEALAAALVEPEVRRRILDWEPGSPAQAAAMEAAYRRTFVLGEPPDYEPGPERSLAGLAAARGCTPLEVAYDVMAADGGQGLLYIPILNYAQGNLDHVRDMLLHPRGALGLSDGGAHTGTICDASMPTFMLTHWTRDRSRGDRLPLEYIVKKQTHDTARMYGLSDRGTVEVGAVADFNLIDYDGLTLGSPFVQHDLPAGGRRLLQRADGHVGPHQRRDGDLRKRPGDGRASRSIATGESLRRRARKTAPDGGRHKTHYAQHATASTSATRSGATGRSTCSRFNNGLMISIDETSDEPNWLRYEERLAEFCRLIRFDALGLGLSDPLPTGVAPTVEGWALDALAVLAHAGSANPVVLAPVGGTLPALWLAAHHPDVVTSLVVVNGTARVLRDVDYPIGIDPDLVPLDPVNIDITSVSEEVPNDIAIYVPSLAHRVGFQQWWGRAARRGASPATATAWNLTNFTADMRSELVAITCPTLIISRTETFGDLVEHGRYLSESSRRAFS